MAVRGTRRPGSKPRRLLHNDGQRRTADHRPRQGRRHSRLLGDLSAPRHADRRRLRHLRHVHLPVPPVGLRTRRPTARRTGHGTHRGIHQVGVGPAESVGRGVARFSVRQLRRNGQAAGTDARGLRTLPRALRPLQRRQSRQLHADRPAVELEGDVRELQRRLSRQPLAPHHPGLLPQQPRRVPGAVGRQPRT